MSRRLERKALHSQNQVGHEESPGRLRQEHSRWEEGKQELELYIQVGECSSFDVSPASKE
jgi:hypothetical protein